MSLLRAVRVKAVELSTDRSQPCANLWHRLSHANVRSRTLRRGRTSNPFAVSGTLDDLERPVAAAPERCLQLIPGTAAIGEHMARPREAVPDGAEDVRSAIAVLDVRRMDDGKQQQVERIGHDVTLAPLDANAGMAPSL